MILLIENNTNKVLGVYSDTSFTPITDNSYSIKISDIEIPIGTNNIFYINNKLIFKSDEPNDKEYLLSKINKNYENAVSQLVSYVPDSEISTWTKQEQEARNYLIDNNTNTPLIDAICLSRCCDKTYLVDKIIQKANAYASAIGALVGERQKQEKLILDGE